jgi:hypothetical protein
MVQLLLKSTRTDSFGRYRLEGLPAGEFTLGVNLISSSTARTAYPATGLTISLQPDENLSEVRLQLPSH